MRDKDYKILMRADGSGEIGMGHIMRCIGLAQKLRERGGQVVFALGMHSDPVVDRLKFEGFECRVLDVVPGSIEDSTATITACNSLSVSMVLVDGYHFDGDWLESIAAPGRKLMLWTDYLQSEFLPVDLLLNQNPHASKSEHQRASPQARILIGLNYAVLRSEFTDHSGLRRLRTGVDNLLVTMGGADPAGMTLQVLNALLLNPPAISVTVVAGPANSAYNEINEMASRLTQCRVLKSVQNMSSLIAQADLAISAAGTTLWEFAYAGLPTLAVSIAENQEPLGESLGAYGGGVYLGKASEVGETELLDGLNALIDNTLKIEDMSKRMMSWVDGAGAERVARIIEEQLDMM